MQKGTTPPPSSCTVLLRNNMIRYVHLPNKIKLGRHSTQMILLPCPGRGWGVTHSDLTHFDLKEVLWKATNATGFAWCHLGEAVFMPIAPHPHPMLATTLLQVPQSFLSPSTLGMGPLPLHHMVSTSVLEQLLSSSCLSVMVCGH